MTYSIIANFIKRKIFDGKGIAKAECSPEVFKLLPSF